MARSNRRLPRQPARRRRGRGRFNRGRQTRIQHVFGAALLDRILLGHGVEPKQSGPVQPSSGWPKLIRCAGGNPGGQPGEPCQATGGGYPRWCWRRRKSPMIWAAGAPRPRPQPARQSASMQPLVQDVGSPIKRSIVGQGSLILKRSRDIPLGRSGVAVSFNSCAQVARILSA